MKSQVHTKPSSGRELNNLRKRIKELEEQNSLYQQELELLEEREKRFQLIFELSAETIVLLDKRGNILAVNSRVYDWLHYDPEYLIGKNISRLPFFTRANKLKAIKRFRQTMQGNAVSSIELEFLTKNGDLRIGQVIESPIKDENGKIVQDLVMISDITDRKRVEANLFKSEGRFRELLQNLPNIAIQGFNKNRKIFFWNKTSEKLFGYSADEVIGKRLEQFIIQPEYRNKFIQDFNNWLNHSKHIPNFESQFRHKNGEPAPVHVSYLMLNSINGDKEYYCIEINLTETKKAEKAILDSTEGYRKLFDLANDAIFLMDGEKFIQCNRKTLEMFKCDRQQIIGQTPYKFSPVNQPDGSKSRAKAKKLINRAFKGERLFFEWQHCKLDGTPFDAEVSITKIELPDKPFILAVVRDISQKIHAQQELSKTRALLQAAVDQLPAGIIIAEAPDVKIRLANLEALKIRGNPEDRSTNNPFEVQPGKWRVYHSDGSAFRPEELPLCRAILSGETTKNLDAIIKGQDGSERWVLANAAPIRDENDEIIAGVVVFPDVTDRRLFEQENNMLAHAMMSVSDCVSITDLQGKIIFVNNALLRTFGYAREELIGKSNKILYSNKIEKEFLKELRNATLNNGWRGEILNKKKDGTEFQLYLSTSVVKDEHGNPGALVSVARDITEKKQFEEHLRQVQKLEAIGRLAGGVAHDFNNMLMVIRGYCELLLVRLDKEDSLYHTVQQIDNAGARAESLTKQLLAFSRKQILQPKVLDLNDLIHNMEKMLRRLIGENIEMRTVYNAKFPNIRGDHGQIQQVIMNLVVNAKDAMMDSGKLTIETRNFIFDNEYLKDHTVAKAGNYIMIAVSDDGVGIDKKTQERIFEPFFTTKEQGKGTGLGLATVYGIVKQSGGFIWVYSEPGVGTSFKIYLPLIDEHVTFHENLEDLNEDIMGDETILIAEDEEEVRFLISETLKRCGYNIIESPNGTDAIQKGMEYKNPINLLLTDVVMPQMSGRELVQKFRSLRPATKVLYMSGYTDSSIIHQGILDSKTQFIQKPFTPVALARKIREILDYNSLE
jgi:PAS domain S-box-containing protein